MTPETQLFGLNLAGWKFPLSFRPMQQGCRCVDLSFCFTERMFIDCIEVRVTWYTVETLYNTINFCSSTHKRHSIARPKGRGMGCLLWVQRATYWLCRLTKIELYKICTIINRAIKGLHCILKLYYFMLNKSCLSLSLNFVGAVRKTKRIVYNLWVWTFIYIYI